MELSLSRPLLLRGKVVQPDGSAVDRYVLVRDGVIAAVSRRRPPLTEEALLVETGGNDWIFPGLLDLHSHTDKNVMPIWEHNKGFFANRFVWRGDADYKRDINGVAKAVKASLPNTAKPAIAAFAELQAIAGGTTTLQEDWDLDKNMSGGLNPVMCRGTGSPEDLHLPPDRSTPSVTDLFKPNKTFDEAYEATRWGTDKKRVDEYVEDRDLGKLQATLVHLAEGRSGFGSDDPGVDPYTRLEWETFMEHPSMRDPEKVRTSSVVLIHGCGIDVHNPDHIEFLRERNMSVIWSPVSNLLLYGDTLEVEPLVAGGVNVALGSDWSPSGSKHVWDEAINARFFFQALGSMVSDVQIFQMVTTNAARCLGLENAGRIAPGCLADFFILRSPLESDSAMEVFFKTADRDVRAVLIGGVPIYGAEDFLQPFKLPLQKLPQVEGESVKDKVVHLPGHVKVKIDRDIDRLEAAFKKHGVLRSNLLVSSDMPYRRRIARLRKYMLEFGWRARRWRRRRRRGLAPLQVRVAPDAVLVRRGFRAAETKPADFRDKLGAVFMPSAVQMQAPLGMTAYLSAVLPDDHPDGVPDEIALVCYESPDAYEQTSATSAGRAYGLLEQTLFSSQCKSKFPVLLGNQVKPEQPYYLLKRAADWQPGFCRVLVGCRPDEQQPAAFHKALFTALKRIQGKPPAALDGAIALTCENVFVYWEHWIDADTVGDRPLEELAKLVSVVLQTDVVPRKVSGDFFGPEKGIEIEGAAGFNLQFDRRIHTV
jgi:5-methylthioadenosine/S-adenosylhomocysteine deaminase